MNTQEPRGPVDVETGRAPGELDTDAITVRTLEERDLPAVVELDTAVSGRGRGEYFARLLKKALQQSDLLVSLVAEVDGRVAGYLVGTLFYGEFGVVEPFATLDAVGVDPALRRRSIGRALMEQFRRNLRGLGIGSIRTEVAWDEFDLLAFFRQEGFRPAARWCLDLKLD